MLMMWIYLMAFVFVMGMAINTVNYDKENKE